MAFTTRVHEVCTCLKRKKYYRLLFPRFGGFFASSGVLISGRICVIGKHWYSSQAHAGHFLRSCSLLSRVSSFPQSRQTYLPGPTFCPALYVFCSVKRFTKTFMHVNDIYELRSCYDKINLIWHHLCKDILHIFFKVYYGRESYRHSGQPAH